MQNIKLIKAKDISTPVREDKVKSCYTIHELPLSNSNLYSNLDEMLQYFRGNHLTGSLTIFFGTGGIAGGEYSIITKK